MNTCEHCRERVPDSALVQVQQALRGFSARQRQAYELMADYPLPDVLCATCCNATISAVNGALAPGGQANE